MSASGLGMVDVIVGKNATASESGRYSSKSSARSCISKTRCWLFSPRRHPGARRGRLFGSGGIVSSSRILCGLEGAGGRPAGIDISKIEGVKLGPENVALGTQRGVGQFLFRAGARVFHDPRQGELGVLRSLGETAGEIVQSAGEPGVVLAHAIQAKSDEFVGEEFGQGRSDGFQVRASGYEVDVGLDCETRPGKNAIAAESLFARQAGGFHETQPLFDAAGLGVIAIVIEDAFAPGDAEPGVFAARENCGVFDG